MFELAYHDATVQIVSCHVTGTSPYGIRVVRWLLLKIKDVESLFVKLKVIIHILRRFCFYRLFTKGLCFVKTERDTRKTTPGAFKDLSFPQKPIRIYKYFESTFNSIIFQAFLRFYSLGDRWNEINLFFIFFGHLHLKTLFKCLVRQKHVWDRIFVSMTWRIVFEYLSYLITKTRYHDYKRMRDIIRTLVAEEMYNAFTFLRAKQYETIHDELTIKYLFPEET